MRLAAILMTITLLSVIAAASIGWPAAGPQGGDAEDKTVYSVDLGGGDGLLLSGDFLPERAALSFEIRQDEVAFVLDPQKASEYGYYSWSLYQWDHASSNSTRVYRPYSGEEPINKAEATLHYFMVMGDGSHGVPGAGKFTVKVSCFESEGGREVAAYTGSVTYITSVERSYSWSFGGETYEMSVEFSYGDYDARRSGGYNRWPLQDSYPSFMDPLDPVVLEIASGLEAAYGPRAEGDERFADFVLSFVQLCFLYPPYTTAMNADMYLFGSEEHFLYPVETVFWGAGDCEDTAILAASLYVALGYDAALLILPEHAMVAVALDESHSPGAVQGFEGLTVSKGGKTYFAGETTAERYVPLGLASATAAAGFKKALASDSGLYGLYFPE